MLGHLLHLTGIYRHVLFTCNLEYDGSHEQMSRQSVPFTNCSSGQKSLKSYRDTVLDHNIIIHVANLRVLLSSVCLLCCK